MWLSHGFFALAGSSIKLHPLPLALRLCICFTRRLRSPETPVSNSNLTGSAAFSWIDIYTFVCCLDLALLRHYKSTSRTLMRLLHFISHDVGDLRDASIMEKRITQSH